MDKKELTAVLAKLDIKVIDGKVNKTAVIAALDKIRVKADTAESGHMTDEHHNKVLDVIAEWREYTEGYDQPENKMAKDMCLKALDCAAHCLSMAADSCKQLSDAEDEEGGEMDLGEENNEMMEEVMDMPEEEIPEEVL